MRRLAFCVCLGALWVCAGPASAATITVNSTADTAANDGACVLREAITASNTNSASGGAAGECAAGSGADTITFSAAFTGTAATSTIALGGSGLLPSITQPVTIAGGNCGSPQPCVGLDINASGGIDVAASNVTISGLAIFDASCALCRAISDADTVTGLTVRNSWFGIALDQTPAQNSFGVLLAGDNAVIGGTAANDRNVFAKHSSEALRILGANNVTVQGNYFGTLPDGTTTTGVGNFKAITVLGDTNIAAANAPIGTLIGGPEAGVAGTCEAPCNVVANSTISNIDLAGSGGTTIPAGQTRIQGNFVGLGASGSDLDTGDITVGAADNVTVGGDASRRNYVTTEITASGGAANLDVVSNYVGLNPAGSARVDDGTIKLADVPPAITGASVVANRVAAGPGASAINLRADGSSVQGNVIGIGTGDEPVGGGSIALAMQTGGTGNQIGGTGAGEGNVIGNTTIAMALSQSGATIAGNVIGTNAAETTVHSVTLVGISLGGGTNNVIGGATAAGENVIANTGAGAIRLDNDGTDANQILRNRGIGNSGNPFIDLRDPAGQGANAGTAANNGIQAPSITAGATAASVSGTGALANATIRVYRTTGAAGSSPLNATSFVGSATANGSGAWALTCPSPGCEQQAQGGDRFAATQTDALGNTSELSNAVQYTDLVPDGSIDSGPADGGLTNDPTPTFGFSSSEPGSTFECSVDGSAFGACSGPGATHTTGALADGQHTFAVRVTDSSANQDPTPALRSFTVDTVGPDTLIDAGPVDGSTIADATASFAFSSSEPGSGFECRLDGAAFGPCSGPGGTHVVTGLGEGTHLFEVRALDGLGNADATPAARTFTVDLPSGEPPSGNADKTPPQTTIEKQPKPKTSKRRARFAFSTNEAGATFECKLDRAGFEPCSDTPKFRVKPGKHKLAVRAADVSGNVDPTPAVAKWRVRKP